jgi:predicted nucleic acid-binding protein
VTADSPEILVCDTSIASMMRYLTRQPQRVAHWPRHEVDRLSAARLTISVITLAETEFGYLTARQDPDFVESERRRLRTFGLLPIDADVIRSWAMLRDALRRAGRTCGDNDVWIAATAHSRGLPVVTADTDFLPLGEHVDVRYLKRKPDSRDG